MSVLYLQLKVSWTEVVPEVMEPDGDPLSILLVSSGIPVPSLVSLTVILGSPRDNSGVSPLTASGTASRAAVAMQELVTDVASRRTVSLRTSISLILDLRLGML